VEGIHLFSSLFGKMLLKPLSIKDAGTGSKESTLFIFSVEKVGTRVPRERRVQGRG